VSHKIANNSSSNIYSSKFQAFQSQTETQQLKFKSHNCETYNFPFSVDELTDTVTKSHDTAVGPDDIHYQMKNTCHLMLSKLC